MKWRAKRAAINSGVDELRGAIEAIVQRVGKPIKERPSKSAMHVGASLGMGQHKVESTANVTEKSSPSPARVASYQA